MIEIVGGFGIVCITVLQGANLWQSRRLSVKIDQMVCEKTCGERQTLCKQAVSKEMEHQSRELRIIERKMDHHSHNGVGVKYHPVSVE